MQRFLLALCLLLLGSAVAQNQTAASTNSSAAAQNQTTTTTTNSSSTALIVANLFNSSLCQDDTVDIRTYVDGQCNQIGSQSVWLTCNQTDPSNPFILWQAFSNQAACMSALSNGAAALALNASTTYGDYCSPIGNDTALNIIACTDAAHVANITTVPAFATLSPTNANLTYTMYAWNVPNCQGQPTVEQVTRFVSECTLNPEYWGPSAGFCVPGALMWASYSDTECTQLNTSAPFTLEPTGICFSAGDFSYMYGPCQPTFNYTGFSSVPPALNLPALLAQLTPTNGSAALSVPPANSSQSFNVQVFQDTQCTTKIANAHGLQTFEFGNCTVNPNVDPEAVGADKSFEFLCTDVGVLAVSFNNRNCSGHHHSSELYRFNQCSTSDLLGFPLAVSQCTASQIPASI